MPLPLGATTGVDDVLLDLFLVLLAAKLGDELLRRLRQPALVGEILAGVLIGPSVLGLVELGPVLEVFAELGVVLLLFWVGLETRLSDLRAVGGVAAGTGLAGVVVPFAAGVGVGFALGESTATSVFLGAALTATSVGITSAVLVALDAVGTRDGRIILGAAVLDDVLALVLVAVAVGVAEDSTSVGSIVVVLGIAIGFVGFVAVGGTRLLAARPQLLEAPRFADSPLLPAVLLCLGLAAVSAQIGLAAIIGAFLAGMIVAETKEQSPVEKEIEPLYAFFPPFFFVAIGVQVDLGALADGGTLLLLVGITALAVVTKLLPAWLASGSRVVGIGMVPRGEVGIIVAGIGATAGVVDAELFAVIVGMSVLTTLLVPPALRRALA